MESAPKDGTPFLVLRAVTGAVPGGQSYAIPEINLIYRKRTSPESDGYWSSRGHSVADDYVSGCLWAPVDALPIRSLYQRNEDRRREASIKFGYGNEDLPLPWPYAAPVPEPGNSNG